MSLALTVAGQVAQEQRALQPLRLLLRRPLPARLIWRGLQVMCLK